ncbi:MAG: hypothetical protein ACXWC8_16260 [Limisphaerales bacterium]
MKQLYSKSLKTIAALVMGAGLSTDQTQARPLGIDVSSYQGSGINWSSV